MGISSLKIVNTDYIDHDVSSLPDKLTGTAAENKSDFDRIVKELVAIRVNALIDALTSTDAEDSGALNIGVSMVGDMASGTVQAAIAELKGNIDSNDDAALHKTGTETITGTKIFSSSPTVPNPEASTDAATRGYVDDLLDDTTINGMSNPGGNITIAGGTGIRVTNSSNTVTLDATGTAIPAPHASQHAAGGEDEVTPESIGAQSQHTAETAVLEAAEWSNDEQTVSVTGVKADSTVFVSPCPAAQDDYTAAGIKCTAQGEGTLTFSCASIPGDDISVNIVILEG